MPSPFTICRRALRRTAVVATLAAATILFAMAPGQKTDASVFDPQVATLDNGLEIVVVTNRRAPVVTHMVWYRVGAMDEPPGLSGIAHYLEHMMFKGTDSLAPGEFSSTIARNGGQDNAFTASDYTGYFQNIAADRLDLVMRLEADRMQNLRLSDEEVEMERHVILEERRSRTDISPGARLREQATAALYMNHPYRLPIIGWEHEIRAIATEDLDAFYRQWYAPNNAVLVVVGDVDMDDVLPLAREHYGPIPAVDLPERVDLEEPPRAGDVRIVLQEATVTEPSWSQRFLAPSYNYGASEHAYALQVAAQVLGGGSTSRLYEALVVDGKQASSAGAWYSPSARGPSEFGFYLSPASGVALEDAEAAMLEEIARVLRDGVSEDDVRRAIVRLQDSAEFAKDSLMGVGRIFGSALVIGRTVEDIEDWPERIGSVTAAEVNAALAAVLSDRGSVTSVLLPGGERS